MSGKHSNVLYDHVQGSTFYAGIAAQAPIGSTISIPFKSEYLRNNYRCLNDIDPTNKGASAIRVLILFIVDAINHTLSPRRKKEPAPKRRRANEEGEATEDEQPEAETHTGNTVDVEVIAKQHPEFANEIRTVFNAVVPRVVCQIEFIPKAATPNRKYGNLEGLVFNFVILDSTLKWERIWRDYCDYNASSKRKQHVRENDMSDAAILSKFADYRKAVNQYIYCLDYADETNENMDLSDIFNRIRAVGTFKYPDEYIELRDGQQGFIVEHPLARTIFDVHVYNLNVPTFKRLAFPWIEERSKRDEILLGTQYKEDAAKFDRVMAAYGIKCENERITTRSKVIREDDPFNAARIKADKLYEKMIDDAPNIPKFRDDGNMDWSRAPSYKAKHEAYLEMQKEYFSGDVWFSSNPNLPSSIAPVFEYIAECRANKTETIEWSPLHGRSNPTNFGVVGEFFVYLQHFVEMNAPPESAMTKMPHLFAAAFSVYFLNPNVNKALHSAILGPPACGKSWSVQHISRVLIPNTTTGAGSSSTYAREHGNGEMRTIRLREETSAAERVDPNSRVDLAQTNSRLTGKSSHDTTMVIKDQDGNEKRVSVTFNNDVTEVNINVANQGFGDDMSKLDDTQRANISRFHKMRFSNACIRDRLSTASKALRASFTRDTRALSRSRQYWQFMQAMCVYRMVAESERVIPEVDLNLCAAILSVITEKYKAVAFDSRVIEDIKLTVSIFQFMFAVTYYCFCLHPNEPVADFFEIDHIREIMKLAIGRPEIVYFVTAEFIFDKTKQSHRVAVRKYASRSHLYRNNRLFFNTSEYEPITEGMKTIIRDSGCYEIREAMNGFVIELKDAASLKPFCITWHHTRDETSKKWVSTAKPKVLETCGMNMFDVKPTVANQHLKVEPNERITFYEFENEAKDRQLDVNYVRIATGRINDFNRPTSKSTFKLDADGEDISASKFIEILNDLKNDTFICAWLPPISTTSELANHPSLLLSLHLAENANKIYCKMPVLLETSTGLYALVKWLESDPNYIVAGILNKTFYRKTPSRRTVLSTAGEPWISYQTFDLTPIPDAKLSVPSLTTLNQHSLEWINRQSPLEFKGDCDEMVFYNEDFVEYFAKSYWVRHFPENDPDVLWNESSDQRLNTYFDARRPADGESVYPACLVKTLRQHYDDALAESGDVRAQPNYANPTMEATANLVAEMSVAQLETLAQMRAKKTQYKK